MIHSFESLKLIEQEIVTCERILKLHEARANTEVGAYGAYGALCVARGRLDGLRNLLNQMNTQNEIALNEQYLETVVPHEGPPGPYNRKF